jgi:TM2 domain-containing membrane protein YozV
MDFNMFFAALFSGKMMGNVCRGYIKWVLVYFLYVLIMIFFIFLYYGAVGLAKKGEQLHKKLWSPAQKYPLMIILHCKIYAIF